MWEEVRTDRYGRTAVVLAWSDGTRDRITFERLSDRQVHHWFKTFAKRGTLYNETRLLREECERRGLSTDVETLNGQLTLF